MASVDSALPEGARTAPSTRTSEAVCGAVAIVLTILGLAHVAPVFLVAVAAIAIGIALGIQGMSIAIEYGRLLARVGEAGAQFADFAGHSSWTTGILAGAGGIVLAILALLGIDSVDLVAIAVIAYGGGLILNVGSGIQHSAARLAMQSLEQPYQRLASDVMSSSVGAQVMAGLAAVVLGILALAGFSSLVLVLVAILALGTFILVNGSTLGGVLISILRR